MTISYLEALVDGGGIAAPDPRTARSAAELVQRLGELRLWCGQPSLRTLRRLGGTAMVASGAVIDALPTSTTSYVLNGRGLPRLPRMEFIEAFVDACLQACGCQPAERERQADRWRDAWRALAVTAGDAQPGLTGVSGR